MRPDPDRSPLRRPSLDGRGVGRARAALVVTAQLLTGCIVPLPLEQQRQVDGGQTLIVKGARDPFGTLRAPNPTFGYTFDIDVVTDSPDVLGRLYALGSGKCCDIDVSKTDVTRYLQTGATTATETPGRYTISFATVLPCAQGFTVNPVFLIPVIASGGFVSMPPYLEGRGEVDATHYWTVTCP